MILTRLFAPRLARTERKRDELQAKLDAAHQSLIDQRVIISRQMVQIGQLSAEASAQARRAGYNAEQHRLLMSGLTRLMESWDRLGAAGSVQYAASELRGLLQQLGVLSFDPGAAAAPDQGPAQVAQP